VGVSGLWPGGDGGGKSRASTGSAKRVARGAGCGAGAALPKRTPDPQAALGRGAPRGTEERDPQDHAPESRSLPLPCPGWCARSVLQTGVVRRGRRLLGFRVAESVPSRPFLPSRAGRTESRISCCRSRTTHSTDASAAARDGVRRPHASLPFGLSHEHRRESSTTEPDLVRAPA